MTTAPPPAHYGAVEGALASGFATAELHHLWGHDQAERRIQVLRHGPYVRLSRITTSCCLGSNVYF